MACRGIGGFDASSCAERHGFGAWMVPVHGGFRFEYEKGIWWMPWRQEAMKDVARCENPGGAASRL